MRLDHVTAVVTDADAAAEVLQRLIGAAPVARVVLPGMTIRSFRLGDAEIHVNAPAGPGLVDDHHRQHGPSYHHVALRVDDLDATLAELLGKGFGVLGAPVETAPGLREVFLDPKTTAGIVIQIVERQAAHGGTYALDGTRIARLAEQTRGLSADPEELVARVAAAGADASSDELDGIVRLQHYLPVACGARIHLTETFSLRCLLRRPHRRAVLMLPGPVATGALFNVPVAGYDSGEILARRGFFAFAADLEGSGRSSSPADGRDVTFDRSAMNMRSVLEYVLALRHLPSVDLLGESWGGGLAAKLAADASRVRSCTLSGMLYRTPSEVATATFRSDAFRLALDSLPQGYFPTEGAFYDPFTAGAPEDVRAYARATQPGRYATGPLYAAYDLPYFDAPAARVPGLLIQGGLDPNVPPADTTDLAAAYGGPMHAVVIPDGGHIPRLGPPSVSAAFWQAFLDFVDR
jgi:pimeloyl-ACP methyl ester carboxylesterase